VGPGRYNANGREVHWKTPVTVRARGGGVTVAGVRFGPALVLIPRPAGGVVVGGRFYRGRMEFSNRRGALLGVNVLPMKEYLRGALTREMSPSWPIEALKAQAVAGRTYALKNRGRHQDDGFDLCDGTHCQVYGGRAAEHPATNAAVAATEGLVLAGRDQRPINAVFHSCCGGRTEGEGDVWPGGESSSLHPVRCSSCRECPSFRWKGTLDNTRLSRRLAEAGHGVGLVRNLRVRALTRSGRVLSVKVFGARGEREVPANAFRLAAGPQTVKSLWWTAFSRRGNTWTFYGKGWGHGVGMCQWGASGLAKQGRNYKQILSTYYGSARLADESAVP
jgi:stage II sporulation protein D